MNKFYFLLALLICSLAACAKDPIVKLLDDYKMAPVNPVQDRMVVGEIYRDKKREYPLFNPNLDMRDEIQEIMDKIRCNASLPDINMSRSFKVKAGVNVIGRHAAELESIGASSYSVTFHNPKIYRLPYYNLLGDVLPELQEFLPVVCSEKTYWIGALLSVDELEYTFKRSNGASFNADALLYQLGAKIDASIAITEDGSLKFTEPRFIGYKVIELKIEEVETHIETVSKNSMRGKDRRVTLKNEGQNLAAEQEIKAQETTGVSKVATISEILSEELDTALSGDVVKVKKQTIKAKIRDVTAEEIETGK